MATTPMTTVVIRNADVGGRLVDMHVAGDRIQRIGRLDVARIRRGLGRAPYAEFDALGAAVIPGLHDHHIHLMALAADRQSVRVGPPEVSSHHEFYTVLRAAAATTDWVRASGYHESVAGPLDRHVLDNIVRDVPVRVMHRSGAMWIMNSLAMQRADIAHLDHPGVVRTESGELTGELIRCDEALVGRVPATLIDLRSVASELARYGVTGVTDLTPTVNPEAYRPLADAVRSGSFDLDVMITGAVDLPGDAVPELTRGPAKIVIGDHELPSIDDLAASMQRAHNVGRPVAVHCVTREALVLALAAWADTGAINGDRIEHGAVIPVELFASIKELGLTVVTQPSFIVERGDTYLAEVPIDDHDDLWRCGTLVAAGVPVAGSTDAPFGHPDPWRAMNSAVTRMTANGAVLGAGERVSRTSAMKMFLTWPDTPGGAARSLAIGGRADLVILDAPLKDVLGDLCSDHVLTTVAAGKVAWPR